MVKDTSCLKFLTNVGVSEVNSLQYPPWFVNGRDYNISINKRHKIKLKSTTFTEKNWKQ
jgi:hypothetical protein